jgi:hypothetical protein
VLEQDPTGYPGFDLNCVGFHGNWLMANGWGRESLDRCRGVYVRLILSNQCYLKWEVVTFVVKCGLERLAG